MKEEEPADVITRRDFWPGRLDASVAYASVALSLGAVTLVLLSGCAGHSAGPLSTSGEESGRSAPAGTQAGSGASAAVPARESNTNATSSREVQELSSTFTGAYPALMTYEPARLEAKPGVRVRLTFHNADHNPLGKHNWKLKDVSNATKQVEIGEADTIEFDAPAPGTYVYICAVPQHEVLGMKGEFVVAPA